MSTSLSSGPSKRLTGVALYDPLREEEVIERARSANPGPLDEEAIVELFGCIIRESRRIEACAMERGESGKMSDTL